MKSLNVGRTSRGLVVGALLCAAMATTVVAADPGGVYGLDTGKLAIKVQVAGLLKGSAALPNLKTLNQRTGLKGQMTFVPVPGQDGNFELGLPPLPLIGSLSMPGMWTAAGSKFTVSMITDEQVQQTIALLNDGLGRTDITGRVTKRTFNGKVSGTNQVSCTFALGLEIGVPPVTIQISVTGAGGGAYVGPAPTVATALAPMAPPVRDFLTEFVVEEVREVVAAR